MHGGRQTRCSGHVNHASGRPAFKTPVLSTPALSGHRCFIFSRLLVALATECGSYITAAAWSAEGHALTPSLLFRKFGFRALSAQAQRSHQTGLNPYCLPSVNIYLLSIPYKRPGGPEPCRIRSRGTPPLPAIRAYLSKLRLSSDVGIILLMLLACLGMISLDLRQCWVSSEVSIKRREDGDGEPGASIAGRAHDTFMIADAVLLSLREQGIIDGTGPLHRAAGTNDHAGFPASLIVSDVSDRRAWRLACTFVRRHLTRRDLCGS